MATIKASQRENSHISEASKLVLPINWLRTGWKKWLTPHVLGSNGIHVLLSSPTGSILGHMLQRLLKPFQKLCRLLTGASGVELSSLDDSTGTIRVPSRVGRLEEIEGNITSIDMLKWIEQSLDVAESIRAKEKFWRVNCAPIEDLSFEVTQNLGEAFKKSSEHCIWRTGTRSKIRTSWLP